MRHCSVLKRIDLSSHEKTWKDTKCILLSGRSQSEKAAYYMIPIIWYSGKDGTMYSKKLSGSQELGGKGRMN